MKKFFTNVLKQFLFGSLLVWFYFPAHSQQTIDINVAGAKNMQAQESNNILVQQMFKDADRYREFEYNKQLANLKTNNIGDTLLLNFFDDRQYKAVIQRVATNLNGRTSIISKIADTEFAYCYMVVSATTISISAELPQKDEHFFAVVKNGQAYITQVKKSELDKTALETSNDIVNLPNQKLQNSIQKDAKGIDDPVIIDLLFVYTPAAEQWALNDSRVTDIYDLIDQALQRSNTTMENSCTGITFNIVYEHLTDYVETNTSEDLYRITDPWDGYMDEVHVLRDLYYADEIVFIPEVDFTGGVAWLLDDEDGFWDDYYAVALSRVQQSSWTYTVVHEIGHNMGCGHHAEQLYQAGPGLFYFSSGWRGIINGDKVCTVMTYESGSYFDDGQTHVRIPYFSSPEIIIDGVPIGDPVTADNVLTLKRTKTAVANYRNPPTPQLMVNPASLNFPNIPCGTVSLSQDISVSSVGLLNDINYLITGNDEAAFNIALTSWNPATGGVLSVTFSPTETKVYSATITFSSQNAANKVVTLTGTGVFTITATTDGNGTTSPSGIITVNQGETKQISFIPNAGYQIEDVLVDDLSNFEAIKNGFHIFENIVSNHTIHVIFSFLGVHENIFDNLKVYTYLNYVVIQNETQLILNSVEIFDMKGQLIYCGKITDKETVLPLQVNNGVYSVRLIFQDDSVVVRNVSIVR
jgi:hypothetical protein